MGIWAALTGSDNPANAPQPQSGRRAARVARRGGNAIVATTSAPRPGRVARVRSGGRGGSK